tara:strand:- start:6922 stop:9402 length:2481 start_codon:yes stop_codon:yes gene_type:complete
MAERIVSPGVFTNEVDQSFLAGGVAQIGAAIVGSTVKGPALVPTQITSYGEFEQIFGSYTDDSYVPFVVNDYLRNGNVITVTRLLYEDGYSITNGAIGVIAKSGSGAGKVETVTHILHPTQAVLGAGSVVNAAYFEDSVINNNSSGSFEIKVSGSFTTDTTIPGFSAFLAGNGASTSASIVSTDNSYITKTYGKSPKSVDYPVYVQYENKAASSLFNKLADVTISLAQVTGSAYSFLEDYKTAATPFITSQKIGTTAKNLFKFHTLSHGTSVSSEVKIGIRDVRLASEVSDPNGYGTFTVEVRRVNTTNIVNTPYSSQDTDRTPDIVESFTNLNLDPDSPRYISRVIGDRYSTITDAGDIVVNGDYINLSKFIRVEVDPGVSEKTNTETLIPFGYVALTSPIPMYSSSLNLTATATLTSQVQTTFSSRNYFGFDFTNLNNLNYLSPIPTVLSTTGSNVDFYLGDVSQDAGADFPTSTTAYSGSLTTALNANTFTSNVSVNTRKFMVPMQGGFDGARPNLPKLSGTNIKSTNTFGFDCSGTATTGTKAYNKAFALLSNADYYDMNMLITPGVIDSIHPLVTSAARNLVEQRQDTFYIMDSNVLTDNIATVVQQVTNIDSNYAATYFPWVRVVDPGKNKPIFVPPSVVMPGVLAFNDAVTAPWYAPAGLTRGGLTTAIGTYKNLSQSNRDTLYENRVNPIANFPNEGICVWGQKTLQARPSALDRVNVRRLLIEVKKFIASSTRYLVFEQNTSATRNRFLSIVNPYLEQVRAQQGLSAFRVVMDETNNTPDVIDRNIMYGQIFLQPTRTAEFIVLDFNIQPTGASFPE